MTTPTNPSLDPDALEQARQLIESARRPLLVCHISPDGDAIGSLTALGRALRQRGHDPILACADPIPHRFDYLAGSESVVSEIDGHFDAVNLFDAVNSFDAVISLDCSDTARIGHLAQLTGFRDVPLLNVDHHLTNLYFGDVNLVDQEASSTAEIVWRLLRRLNVSVDAEIATSLLTGLVTDTRGFRTSNVTPQVLETALQLMKAGASLAYVTRQALERRPVTAIRLWKEALSTVQIEEEHRIIWAAIPQAMRQKSGYAGNGNAGLTSFLISADAMDAAVIFVEREDGRIEIGFRATPGFDVAQVALQFGGGGHALAAGCNVPGPLEEARERVLSTLRTSLAQQRPSSSSSAPSSS